MRRQIASPSSRRAWIEILWLLLGLVVALVALLAEGVDRNYRGGCSYMLVCRVALLAEGVDRNLIMSMPIAMSAKSPSSRRAWIEITVFVVSKKRVLSPSSRRAWIEI